MHTLSKQKSKDSRQAFKHSVLKQTFLGQNDQEFLGLIGDHLVQLADLSDLNIHDGAYAS